MAAKGLGKGEGAKGAGRGVRCKKRISSRFTHYGSRTSLLLTFLNDESPCYQVVPALFVWVNNCPKESHETRQSRKEEGNFSPQCSPQPARSAVSKHDFESDHCFPDCPIRQSMGKRSVNWEAENQHVSEKVSLLNLIPNPPEIFPACSREQKSIAQSEHPSSSTPNQNVKDESDEPEPRWR